MSSIHAAVLSFERSAQNLLARIANPDTPSLSKLEAEKIASCLKKLEDSVVRLDSDSLEGERPPFHVGSLHADVTSDNLSLMLCHESHRVRP
jgi:hypothetical protein